MPNLGTLTTNGTFYIIESPTNTYKLKQTQMVELATQGDLGVTYSPNYGSQVVQEFTSSPFYTQ